MKLSNLAKLRRSLLTGVAVRFLACTHGHAATLLQYQMGTNSAQIQDAINTAAGGVLTPGIGMSLFNTNALTQTLNGSVAPTLALAPINGSTTFALAVANQSWFTFNLTVGSGVADLDLTSLTFNSGRGGAGTPRGFGVFVTTPTTTDEAVQGATDLTTARPANIVQNIDLSLFTSLQNLTAGQVVSFKIPVYSLTSTSTLIFDDITVNGNLTLVPEPAAAGLIGLGAVVLLGFRRRQFAR
jgi:hypothetical protein